MKHFIGGFSLGLLLALTLLQKTESKTNTDFYAMIAAHLFFALMLGVAAWGLLP